MKTTIIQQTPIEEFRSDVMPEIETRSREQAVLIEWADANPVAWKIVTQTRSKAWGRGSCVHIGWAQKADSTNAVLERLRRFHQSATAPAYSVSGFDRWAWGAQFTLTHYEDKRFRNGFFEQWDGSHDRHCATLDYTPETLDEVVKRFIEWCGGTYPMRAVRLDGDVIQTFDDKGNPTPTVLHGGGLSKRGKKRGSK